jgi:hypothetical protein
MAAIAGTPLVFPTGLSMVGLLAFVKELRDDRLGREIGSHSGHAKAALSPPQPFHDRRTMHADAPCRPTGA